MNHAENERITHQDSHGGTGRNARGRRANAYPASRCGVSGETYQENTSRRECTTRVQGRRFSRAWSLPLKGCLAESRGAGDRGPSGSQLHRQRERASESWKSDQVAMIAQMKTPRADVLLAVGPAVQTLVEASAASRFCAALVSHLPADYASDACKLGPSHF